MKEEDDEDTAICPFCGVDAVIVGTDDFLISTALLTQLYLEWFGEEFKTRKANATFLPNYRGHKDYLRKGIPFRMSARAGIEFVDEIRLLPMSLVGESSSYPHDGDSPSDASNGGMSDYGDPGDVVGARAYITEEGARVSEFLDDVGWSYPYEPFSGSDWDLLFALTEKYGDSLKCLVKEGGANGKMQLFIEED
jgi:hypothetical protein